jgi:hypothetical protein
MMESINTQTKGMTREEANRFIDDYFAKLETELVGHIKAMFCSTTLFTADGQKLVFPDDVREARDIIEGTGPIKTEDGKIFVGEFVMPNGIKYETDEKGYVKKVTPPTSEEIVAMIRKGAAEIQASLKSFRKEVKDIIGRRPFRKPCK